MTDPSAHQAIEPTTDGVEVAPGVRVPGGVVRFAFSRSSGPGGQNVNKRSTKAELRVRVADLPIREAARARLLEHAGWQATGDGEVVIVCDEHRSQVRNREECLARLRAMIVSARQEPKVRRPTRPSRGSKERRLTAKRVRSERKANRRRHED